MEKNVILLNKPFLGGWLDKKGNIGHEVIDFLSADNGEYYVYNNPWGVCPSDIWVEGTTLLSREKEEKYIGKYLVLTSEERGKDFDILYVIELAEKIHREHTTKNKDNLEYRKSQEKVKTIMRERNIKYKGKFLDQIYNNDDSLFLTFKGARIFKAKNPILVEGLEYNFQRNKGYLYSDKFPDDYSKVHRLIIDSIENGELEVFSPRSVDSSCIGRLSAKKTFLDLIRLETNEQVFTDILYSVLEQGTLFADFCERYKEDKIFDSSSKYNVFRETKVVDGRMDVCGESLNQRVIIENKVFSQLNGLRPVDNMTQLSTYYKWGLEKKLPPLCFVVVPDFRASEIKREINAKDHLMNEVYLIRTYGEIADFIEEQYNNNRIDHSYEYYDLLPQIINAFRNLSYSTKEDLYARMFLEAAD